MFEAWLYDLATNKVSQSNLQSYFQIRIANNIVLFHGAERFHGKPDSKHSENVHCIVTRVRVYRDIVFVSIMLNIS